MHPKWFVGRAPPVPGGAAYSALPHSLAGFNGPTSKGREEGKGGEGSRGDGGREREGICRTNVKLLPTRLDRLMVAVKPY